MTTKKQELPMMKIDQEHETPTDKTHTQPVVKTLSRNLMSNAKIVKPKKTTTPKKSAAPRKTKEIPVKANGPIASALMDHVTSTKKSYLSCAPHGTAENVICVRQFIEDKDDALYNELNNLEYARPVVFGNLYPRSLAWTSCNEAFQDDWTSKSDAEKEKSSNSKYDSVNLEVQRPEPETELCKLFFNISDVTKTPWDKCLVIKLSKDCNFYKPGEQYAKPNYHRGFTHSDHKLASVIVQIGQTRSIEIKKDRVQNKFTTSTIMNSGDLLFIPEDINEICRHSIPKDANLTEADKHTFFLFFYEEGAQCRA
jgi:hypothetical protein